MSTLLLAALGLGLAGLDPAGALIALAALSTGTRTGLVQAYGLLVLLGTAVWGTVLSLTVGQRLAGLDWSRVLPADPIVAGIEALAGLGALGWAGWRLRRGHDRDSPRRPKKARSGSRLLVVGVLFTLSAALDPTFVGLVVLGGRGEPWWTVALAHLVWAVLSQVPLAVLLVAVARGAHDRVAAVTARWWHRVRPTARVVLTAVLLAVGLVLLTDAGWFVVTGRFLIPGP